MELTGWVATSIWGVVCLLVYLLKISKQWVQAYRIRKGREQMNEWLKVVGNALDQLYVDGQPYSKDALKTWLAKTSVIYFKEVIRKNSEQPINERDPV